MIRDERSELRGVEAVVDKDLTAALLAESVDADALLLLTDVECVQDGYGTPAAHPIRSATCAELRARSFPAGSMGPKIEAACRFAEATGNPAMIGRLADASRLLSGEAGTASPVTDAARLRRPADPGHHYRRVGRGGDSRRAQGHSAARQYEARHGARPAKRRSAPRSSTRKESRWPRPPSVRFDTMIAHPLALQLRNLRAWSSGVDKNTTVVFPAPLMSTIEQRRSPGGGVHPVLGPAATVAPDGEAPVPGAASLTTTGWPCAAALRRLAPARWPAYLGQRAPRRATSGSGSA